MTKQEHNNFAVYKHRDGKTYLKRNGWKKFREVELVREEGGLRVRVKNYKLL